MKPIKIVGGGLAGLSLGVYLRKLGVDTEIIEAGFYPKHKVCGEFICGVSQEILSEMGVDNIVTDSVHHRDMSWWMDDAVVMQDSLPQVAWGISRYKLDEDLAGKFEQLGGVLTTGKRFCSDELALEGVVYGSGKRKDSPKKGRWIGLKIHAVDIPAGEVQGIEMHVGKRGYMGVCGVEDGRLNCCGLFRIDQSLKGRGVDLICQYLEANGMVSLAQRLSSWSVDARSFSATAGFALGEQDTSLASRGRTGKAGAKAFCIGDALQLIPPFTGNGMSMALESSQMAAGWIVRYAGGELSWEESMSGYHDESAAFFQKRMMLSKGMHPLFFNRFSRSILKLSAQTGVLPFEYLFSQLRRP